MSRTVDHPTVAHRIEAALLKFGRGLFGLLGVDRASALSGWCWRTFGPWTARQRRVDYQLRMVFPTISDAEVRRISLAMWENLGRVFAESLMLDALIAEPERLDASHIGDLAEDIAAGRVVSLASLHMGNWELCGPFAHLTGLRLAGVYKRLSNPVVEDWLLEQRGRYYSGGLFNALDRAKTLRGLIGALRSGVSVAMIADLYDRSGTVIDFMGHPAPVVEFPAALARAHGVPLYAARVLRTGGVHFRVEIERVPVPETDDRAADIAAANVAMHAVFARWIAETPEQWFWIHPKWDQSRVVLKGARPKV